MKTLAQAEANQLRITAEGDAEAEKLRANAAEVRYAVDASGKEAINAAVNVLSPEQIAMQVRLRLIEELPQIIQESVKPMERIEGIKIFQVEGLGGGAPAGDGAARGDGGNLAD